MFFVACEDEDSGDGGVSASAVTSHEDVKPIIDAKCATCHQPGQIAPFGLQTYDEVNTMKSLVKEAIVSKEMPPWPVAEGCNDIMHSAALPQEEIDLITKWIDDGAPEGDANNPGAPIELPQQGISRVDLTLAMEGPYTPGGYPDDYRCFVMEWPHTETTYTTGFQAYPGNTELVHHIACYLIAPNLADDARARLGDDPTQGYECFGGPNVSDDPLAPFVLVGVWGPGMVASDFPAGTGLRVEPGSVIVMQVHYSTLNGFQEDLTAVEFKIDDAVEKEGAMLPFLDLDWPANLTMRIPAGDPAATHSYPADPTQNPIYSLYTNGVVKFNEPMVLYSSNLHMHERGKSTSTKIIRADGTEECLLDNPQWDFHWQFFYPFRQETILYPGDQLHVECLWDNSQEVQPWVDGQQMPAQELNWGEGTVDEMCVATLFVSGLD